MEAEKAVIAGSDNTDALELMFNHKSKLLGVVDKSFIEAYKNLLLMLKQMQNNGQIPVHHDYLANNELAINIYKNKYYLKDLKHQLIEHKPEDVFARLAAFMAALESNGKQEEYAIKFYNILFNGHFLPGGRVIAGAGDLYRLKTLANCFVSLIDDDNIESIYKAAYECARTYSYGGGIGVDISNLRPKDSVVHNAADKSTGAVSFMELYSLTTGLIGQSGRRGALMLTLDVKHPDILNFINVKRQPNWVTRQIIEQCKWSNAFDEQQLRVIENQVRENTQIRFANISLKVSDEFMKAVEEETNYGRDSILVYKKYNKVSVRSVLQGDDIHYSFGIPSKNIKDYELFEKFDSIRELNAFLSTFGARVNEEELKNMENRDIFGDYVISTSMNYDLAVKHAGDFMLYFGSEKCGEIKRLVKARQVWDLFIAGNYKTAEPGLIFWTTMSRYSPSNYVGRPIVSTNPCVDADSLISTEKGLERIDSIKAENIIVDSRTLNKTNSSLLNIQYGTQLVKPTNRIMTGYKECYKLETASGYELIATPDHRILTQNGWKELAEIKEDDYVLIQSGEGSFNKDSKLPFEVKNEIIGKNGRAYKLNLPTKWSRELGLLLGWAVGDGFYNEKYHKFGLVFAKEDEEARKTIQPIFEKYCNREIKEIKYPNGCIQLRSSSKFVINFFKTLGLRQAGEEREVPSALFTAIEEAVLGFIEGLFSSDGTIGIGSKSRNYIRLNSSSIKLLKQVQLLLLNLGVRSTIYNRSSRFETFRYINKKGEIIKYKTSGINYELNISKENAARLIQKIVFLQQKNKDKIAILQGFEFYKERFTDKVKSINYIGKREVWDITEDVTHSFIANGIIVHNCAEVPLEDGGACNLGSINLSRFVIDGYTEKARIDWQALGDVAIDTIRFMDNVVSWNEFLNPLEKQRIAAKETKRIGLGIMGIADMLNQLGIAYDSDEGIALMERVSKFIANKAYESSAILAEEKGPSPLWDYEKYSRGAFFQEALDPEVQGLVRQKGLRNIALLSIAPTGTISNIVLGFTHEGRNYIGVSGGIEPIFALYYTRRSESFGNKFFKVFHSTVQAYVDMMRLQDKADLAKDLDELKKVLPSHFFRTAHFIEPEKRVLIQGVCQKYIDHSISSTVNLPESIEPEIISNIYLEAWRKGLKGITIYRDGSRYPILSVQAEQNELQKVKDKTFKVIMQDKELELKGDEVFTLPNGRLSTPFHAIRKDVSGIIITELGKELPEPEIEIKKSDDKDDDSEGAKVCKIEFIDGQLVKTCGD